MSNVEFTNAYSSFVPEVWAKRLEALLYTDTIMMQCVNHNYEGEIKNAGDTVNILTPGDVAVNSLHGGVIDYAEIEPAKQQLVIDQKKFFAFKVNDIASAQAGYDLMEAHLGNAKKAIEVDQDSYLLGLYTDTDEEKWIFVAIKGKNVNHTTLQYMQVKDFPAIILHALGISAPGNWMSHLPEGLFAE